jgi:ABC-type antimicrobial peptide transport system permease subunit
MKLPLSYSIRNLWTRRLTTTLTAAGMSLVVFVFAAILMLAQGLQQTLVQTGTADNIIVIRKGSNTEVQSSITRSQAAIVETDPSIATGISGERLVTKELLVLITLEQRRSAKRGNVSVRGISLPVSMALRPQVKLIEGRLPRPGSFEIIAGKGVATRYQGGRPGETMHFGSYRWKVVGVFDAGNTSFSSEVWGDVEQLMHTFRRPAFSSVLFRISDLSQLKNVVQRLEDAPRLTLEAKQETQYYLEQSRPMATFLRVLGISLPGIFSLGAIIGAMITMYAAVANRVIEIGTLRALGFQKNSILVAFLLEALFLGLIGGIAGLFFASFTQLITVNTANFQTLAEVAFSFTMTPGIIISGLLFSLVMGFVGGVLPAFRAAKMNIVDSLRAR